MILVLQIVLSLMNLCHLYCYTYNVIWCSLQHWVPSFCVVSEMLLGSWLLDDVDCQRVMFLSMYTALCLAAGYCASITQALERLGVDLPYKYIIVASACCSRARPLICICSKLICFLKFNGVIHLSVEITAAHRVHWRYMNDASLYNSQQS